MATDKKISYEMQGNVRNYLGKQKMVRAPLHWQSGPGHPKTQLAYITKPELDLILKKDFHGSLKKGPNVGPSGIMSLNDPGTGRSGSEMSAAETGGSGHGMSDKEARGIRLGAVAAGAQGTKDEMRAAKEEFGRSYRGRDRRTGIGGLLGGIGRGLLGFFGGIPGKIMSGIMTAKNWAKNKGTGFMKGVGEFAEYDEEGNPKYQTWDRFINRNTGKYDDKPYLGHGQGYDFSDTGNNKGLYTDTLGQPIGPGKRVGQDQGYYGMGSQYDQTRMPVNITNNMGANTQFVEEEQNFDPNFYAGNKEGGRIGYERGRVVNPGGYSGDTWRDFLASQAEWQIRPNDDWRTVYHRWLDSQKADGGIARLL